MKTPISAHTKTTHKSSLSKKMFIGSAVALLLISIFLFGVNDPKPEWGKFWMIRPLLVVSFAGAMGGMFYHFMDYFRNKGGWWKILATIASLLAYIIGLWIGTILGLDGTLWD